MSAGSSRLQIDSALAHDLYDRANAGRWGISHEQWIAALAASASRVFGEESPTPRDVVKYLSALHLKDLALAQGCLANDDAAWEHFVRVHRPILYRAADALDRTGSLREIADALYGDLFGATEAGGQRRSLLRYFHGRSSLATWLRAIVAQRFVDHHRAHRKHEPLAEDTHPEVLVVSSAERDPDRERHVTLMRHALARTIAALESRDRLRLGCYYGQGLTLAETGRLLREHEATVSRQLARTRRDIRRAVERLLREEAQLSDAQIAACFESVTADAGPLDLGDLIGPEARKESGR